MLYVFVDREESHVFYATYDENDVKTFCRYNEVKLKAKYFDDVVIYEVIENYDD